MIENTDERLCVDCRRGDSSSVFHVEMLDDPVRARFLMLGAGKEWLFDHDDGPTEFYETEEEACCAQRAYRTRKGFDPVTGNPVRKIYKVTAELYFECGDEAEACNAVAEILREDLREFAGRDSCFIDWRYAPGFPSPVEATDVEVAAMERLP